MTAVSVNAQKLTIKNTIGSDLDSLGEYDLYSHTKQKTYSVSGDSISDNDDSYSDFSFVPSGYIYFKPSEYFSVAAGNNFYKRFSKPTQKKTIPPLFTKLKLPVEYSNCRRTIHSSPQKKTAIKNRRKIPGRITSQKILPVISK